MSVGRSDSMHGVESYNDLEYQKITHFLTINGDGTSSEDAVSSDESFEVTAEGLDRGELAELVGMRSYAQLGSRDGENLQRGENASKVLGHFAADYGVSVNEVSNDSVRPGSEVDITTSGSPESKNARYTVVGDAGELLSRNMSVTAGFRDTATGVGGNGTTQNASVAVNFRQLAGTGPILDRFDDLNVSGTLDAVNTNGVAKFEHRVVLYWNVMEDEDTTGFGRP